MKCGGIITAKQKHNSVEEREYVSLLYPEKAVPGRDAQTSVCVCVCVCEGACLDSMFYERTLPMNRWLGWNGQIPRLPENRGRADVKAMYER